MYTVLIIMYSNIMLWKIIEMCYVCLQQEN